MPCMFSMLIDGKVTEVPDSITFERLRKKGKVLESTPVRLSNSNEWISFWVFRKHFAPSWLNTQSELLIGFKYELVINREIVVVESAEMVRTLELEGKVSGETLIRKKGDTQWMRLKDAKGHSENPSVQDAAAADGLKQGGHLVRSEVDSRKTLLEKVQEIPNSWVIIAAVSIVLTCVFSQVPTELTIWQIEEERKALREQHKKERENAAWEANDRIKTKIMIERWLFPKGY